ncbi:hypothetical protein RWE15_14600 [Virgibacillus halophilus]|uniref:RiboL-PSP-HEPN domain-containing protein n=1 Tax=Tigheibacillus halophilus TaxID=361280 RepID=A0ABU5C7Y5_9BACI|nr:hypothetical protein [Virgibacillus halophilus]
MTDQSIEEINRGLRLASAKMSYPVLKDLAYFREYNNYVENTFESSILELGENPQNKDGRAIPLDFEIIKRVSERNKYRSFRNIMRVSLLTALCSFIENLVKTACVINDRKERYSSYGSEIKARKNADKRVISISKSFLYKEGFSEINNLKGWDYIKDMMRIRNRFVHAGGEADSNIRKMSVRYDFLIENDEITLGDSFIENYISLIEDFSIEFAKIVYPDESFVKKNG